MFNEKQKPDVENAMLDGDGKKFAYEAYDEGVEDGEVVDTDDDTADEVVERDNTKSPWSKEPTGDRFSINSEAKRKASCLIDDVDSCSVDDQNKRHKYDGRGEKHPMFKHETFNKRKNCNAVPDTVRVKNEFFDGGMSYDGHDNFPPSSHQHSGTRCDKNGHGRDDGPAKERRTVMDSFRKGRTMKLCQFYRKNRGCKKNDQCGYLHGEFPCKFHHTGMTCYLGAKCQFSHVKLDENEKKILIKALGAQFAWLSYDPSENNRKNQDSMTNNFDEYEKPFAVQNGFKTSNEQIPSLLKMKIPIPSQFVIKINPDHDVDKRDENSGALTSKDEIPVEDTSSRHCSVTYRQVQILSPQIRRENDRSAQTEYWYGPLLFDDCDESSDDDIDPFKLVIDEDRWLKMKKK